MNGFIICNKQEIRSYCDETLPNSRRQTVEIRQSYDLLRNIGLRVFIMSVPSPFLVNSFSSFLLITYQVFCY